MDEHDFDRLFQATKMINPEDVDIKYAREKHQTDLSDAKEQLFRYEFGELLLRIARFRYMEREKFIKDEEPLAKNYVEAITLLHTQVLRPFFDEITNIWAGFRHN